RCGQAYNRRELPLYPHWVNTIPPVGIVCEGVMKMSHQEREKVKLLQRLRKVRGQLDAVERSLSADEDCGGQLMLLAGAKEQIAPELAEDLIDLVHAYLK